MELSCVAEYSTGSKWLSAEGGLFACIAGKQRKSILIYAFPNVLKKTILLRDVSEILGLRLDLKEEKAFLLHTYPTEEGGGKREAGYRLEMQGAPCPHKDHLPLKGIEVRRSDRGLSVYEQGRETCHVPGDVAHFFCDLMAMKLYTVAECNTIREYDLFQVRDAFPEGIAIIYRERLEIVGRHGRTIRPCICAPRGLLSAAKTGGEWDVLQVAESTVSLNARVSRTFQRFAPSAAYLSGKNAYLYSKSLEKLLVLDRALQTQLDVRVEYLWVGRKHLFMKREGKVIVHSLEDFSYSFFITGLHIGAHTRHIAMFDGGMLHVRKKEMEGAGPLAKHGVGLELFLFKSKTKLALGKARRRAAADGRIQVYDLERDGARARDSEAPARIEPSDVGIVRSISHGSQYIVFMFALDGTLLVLTSDLLLMSMSLRDLAPEIESVLGFDESRGIIYTGLGAASPAEGVSPSLALFRVLAQLVSEGLLPCGVLFSQYGESSGLQKHIEAHMFRLLDKDEIELAKETLDALALHAYGMYERVAATLLRMLDHANQEKLYALMAPETKLRMTDADCLNTILVNDFSLFGKFLRSCIDQRTEFFVLDFVEFAAKIQSSDLHRSIMHALLKHKMLYAVASLLVHLDAPHASETAEALKKTYMRVHQMLDSLSVISEENVDLLGKMFDVPDSDRDSMFIVMLAEKLNVSLQIAAYSRKRASRQ